MISNGSMSASRSGTARHVDVDARPRPSRPSRDDDEDSPAAPRSCSEASSSRSSSSRQHSISFVSSNGSPICTRRALGVVAPRRARRWPARDAPPIPSRPVRAPSSTSTLPDARRRAADQPLVRREPDAHRVDEAVLLVGRLEVDLAADRRHPDRVAVVADARRRPGRAGSASAASRARRSAASRARRSAARRSRRCRAGCRRRRWPRPGRARPRSGGCATRP